MRENRNRSSPQILASRSKWKMDVDLYTENRISLHPAPNGRWNKRSLHFAPIGTWMLICIRRKSVDGQFGKKKEKEKKFFASYFCKLKLQFNSS